MTTTRNAALLVAFMWVAYFLNYCDRQAISAMFPVLKSDLGMTDFQLGLTGTIFLWVYGCGCPIAGQLADKLSKRLLVVLSLAVWSVVTVATGWSSSALMLLGLRAAMGVSESLYMPAAVALTANAHPADKRSRAVAMLTTAQIAGTVGGSWFGGWMAQHGQWRLAFFVLGGIGLLYAVPYYLFLKTVQESSETELSETELSKTHGQLALTQVIRVPTFLLLSFVFPSFLFGLWMLYSWLPSFLFEKFDLTLSDAAFTATVYLQSSTLVGLLCGGILADRLYVKTKAARLYLMTASLLFCAPCLYAIGNSETLNATRLAAAAFGLFAGFFMGNIFPAAFEVVPSNTRASAVGLLNFFGALVSGLAPLVVGIYKKTIGVGQLLSYAALIYLIAAIVLIVGIHVLFQKDFERVQ